MLLYKVDIPVAYSMVSATEASNVDQSSVPFAGYLWLWTAFNNIYVAIAAKDGIGPRLELKNDGTYKFREHIDVQVPVVHPPLERDLINHAYEYFDDELKYALLSHESTIFFVDRIPIWHGAEVARDAAGQSINGIINVGYTADIERPVWAPISKPLFDRFRAGDDDSSIQDKLARQVLYVLYTVRNNIVHAGKQPDDANDAAVVKAATPLVRLIVDHFMAEAA